MLKQLLAIAIALLALYAKLYANWENKSFEFEGYQREYRIYTPQNYSPDKMYSLVLGIHGLGDNISNFPNIVSDFHRIADTADIILVYPHVKLFNRNRLEFRCRNAGNLSERICR